MDPFSLPIPLMSGGQATLQLPRHLSEADFDQFVTHLTTSLKMLRPALTAPAPTPAPPVDPPAPTT